MSDTGPAKLPGLPRLQTGDNQLNAWAEKVNEHLEVRAGSRGNTVEKAATQRDIQALIARIAELEKKLNITPVTTEVATQTKTTVQSTSTSKDFSGDVRRLDTKIDALSSRLLTAEMKSGTTIGYGSGFVKETNDLTVRPNPWAINGSIRWGQTTFTAGFNVIRWVLYESGPASAIDGKNDATLNGNLTITGANGASDGSKTLQGFANRTSADIAALSQRFDGVGKLQTGYMPNYVTLIYNPNNGNNGGLDTSYEATLNYMELLMRQHGWM